ncbi:hypothetical protein M3926_000448 [Vibrio metschnikovii]|nr:hypothetical protein [Vibrio metschnikovii]
MAILIKKIDADFAAEAAGLKENDIILTADGKEVSEDWKVSKLLKDNGYATLVYVRDGNQFTTQVSGQSLGVDFIYGEYEHPVPEGFKPASLKPLAFKTRYALGRDMTFIFSFLGWISVLGGIAILAMKGVDFAWPSITLVFSGVAIVQIAQIGKALIDTADHTRETMNFVSRKLF